MDERSDLAGRGQGYRSDLEPDVPFTETIYEEGITWGAPETETTGSYTAASNTNDMSGDDTDAVRSQIEQTRSDMGQTIDAIQQKLTPSNLVDEAKSAVQDATVGAVGNAVGSATDTVGQAVGSATGAVQQAASGVESTAASLGSTVVETIKQNPIPAALAGVGLGWLIVSVRQQASQQGAKQPPRGYSATGRQASPGGTNPSPYGWYYDEPSPRYTDYPSSSGYTGGYPSGYVGQGQQQSSGGLGEAAGQVQGTVGQAVNQAQDTASQVASQAQDAASQVASQAQQTASQVASQVQNTAGQVVSQAGQSVQGATTGLQEMMRQRPLAVGLMAVGLGAAIGLAVPETRKEDEVMGSAREDLMQRAQQTAQETMQKVGTVAQHTLDAAKQEAEQEAKKQGL